MANVLAELVARWNSSEQSAGVPVESRSFLVTPPGESPRVLILHGAGGGPHDLRDLAESLAAAGHGCLCPLLPAHGRGPRALGELRFPDLVARALETFDVMARDGAPPALLVQSFGAVVGVRVVAQRRARALVALAPALRPFVTTRALWLVPLALYAPRTARATLRWQLEARRAIDETRSLLGSVECPLLVLHSADDRSVSWRGARELYEGARSEQKVIEVLEGQGHVLSDAPEREEKVFAPVRTFLDGVYCSGS